MHWNDLAPFLSAYLLSTGNKARKGISCLRTASDRALELRSVRALLPAFAAAKFKGLEAQFASLEPPAILVSQ
jgi:hypothetical protein